MSKLRKAWDFKQIVRFLPCALLFSFANALISMAFGLKIPAALAVVVGRVYTPICALGSSFILNKFYLWLEWLAIVILTLASASFGAQQGVQTSDDSSGVSPLAIICVIASAASSAMNSLLMEKLMKAETDPFILQKVRIDCGSFLWSILFLPVMGLIGDISGFKRGAFWNYRPTTLQCDRRGQDHKELFICEGTEYVLKQGANVTGSAIECVCARGVLVAWNNPLIFVALLVLVFHSSVTGAVVKQFSSVARALADAMSLMLVYFVGDPLFNDTSLNDNSLNLIALIFPMSSQLFSCASYELEQAEKARKKQARSEQSDSSSSRSVEMTPVK